jgi:valacyclovir hydrolase
MPFIEISTGARLHYQVEGHGEPLIALPGRLGTPDTDLPQVISLLSEHYRVIAPSLRGYGQSTPKPRDFPPDFYHRDARDMLALMDALNIERAHILGYSDGGETVLVMAGIASERILSVIAWGAVGYFGPEMRPFVQRNYPASWMTDHDKRLNGIIDPDAFALEWIAAMKTMIDSGGDVSLSLAEDMTAPLLLMLGDQDSLNPQQYAEALINRTPRGKLVMFEDVGHGIHDEDWDGFKKTVTEFLAGVK